MLYDLFCILLCLSYAFFTFGLGKKYIDAMQNRRIINLYRSVVILSYLLIVWKLEALYTDNGLFPYFMTMGFF